MMIKKRCLLWDWTNTKDVPRQMSQINFEGPMHSVSNWNTWTPPELEGRAPFRPMIRDLTALSGGEWQNIENTKNGLIHFFNEPERANISPQKAAGIWFQQVVSLRQYGNELVSPSCASDLSGEAWISDFLNLVAKDPPDFLGLHYYGADKDSAIQYFEKMHAKYPKHDLFITELASISRDRADVVEFTVDVANWADETSWVSEYAFFGCTRTLADDFVSPAAQLMKADGSLDELMIKLMNEQPMQK